MRQNGFRVLYGAPPTSSSACTLEAAIRKLDKNHLLILDDIAHVRKDQAETSALFELVSSRYERRSMLITENQPFGEWGSGPQLRVARRGGHGGRRNRSSR